MSQRFQVGVIDSHSGELRTLMTDASDLLGAVSRGSAFGEVVEVRRVDPAGLMEWATGLAAVLVIAGGFAWIGAHVGWQPATMILAVLLFTIFAANFSVWRRSRSSEVPTRGLTHITGANGVMLQVGFAAILLAVVVFDQGTLVRGIMPAGIAALIALQALVSLGQVVWRPVLPRPA